MYLFVLKFDWFPDQENLSRVYFFLNIFKKNRVVHTIVFVLSFIHCIVINQEWINYSTIWTKYCRVLGLFHSRASTRKPVNVFIWDPCPSAGACNHPTTSCTTTLSPLFSKTEVCMDAEMKLLFILLSCSRL